MNKMLYELLISSLSISNNYYLNSIIMAVIGLIAFKIAFKVVGDLGVRGEIGSLFHWIIRLLVIALLWCTCCIVIYVARFVITHILLLSGISILCVIIYNVTRNICKHLNN